jgi:hypothetical protein
MIGFTTIITNIWKSFSFSSSEKKIISNKKWKKSMIGFITLWIFENPFPIFQVKIEILQIKIEKIPWHVLSWF